MYQKLEKFTATAIYFVSYILVQSLFTATALLPVGIRREIFISVFSVIFAPLMGWRTRISKNLEYACPDLSETQKKIINIKTCRNLAKTLFEVFTPKYNEKLAQKATISGPGSSILSGLVSNNQPVILVSGHFGNYDIIRSRLISQGVSIGALYRPLNNQWLNKTYLDAIMTTGQPVFPRNKEGITSFLKHIRNGGSAALLVDQHMDNGFPVKFFGKTAYTSGSAAQIALKYRRPLIPIYAIRKENGIDFEIWVDAPIEPSNVIDMTQYLNDSLERIVRDHMDQWAWPHNRWKTARRRETHKKRNYG